MEEFDATTAFFEPQQPTSCVNATTSEENVMPSSPLDKQKNSDVNIATTTTVGGDVEDEDVEDSKATESKPRGSWKQQQDPGSVTKKRSRQRVLIDTHNNNNDNSDTAIPPRQQSATEKENGNEYERERLERIKRNQEIMKQMRLREMALETVVAARPPPPSATITTTTATATTAPKPRRSRPKVPSLPRRHSSRHTHTPTHTSAGELLTSTLLPPLASELDDGSDDHLLSLQEYFESVGVDYSNAIHVDGHYRGWVSSTVAQMYGLPVEHPGEAWFRAAAANQADKRGTGTGGTGTSGRRGKGGKSGSDAKTKASASLSFNPNAYFYRHVAPHQCQAQGEWTGEEKEAFMGVVREWGVGDNWGLFASHIPQRVGYQCSAFYRDVIIPSGMVLDDRFKMQRNGKPVFASR